MYCKNSGLIFITILFFFSSWTVLNKSNPTIFIIGDSTVKNGSGRGENGLYGWGDCLSPFFDSTQISVQNFARGGRSSRTFQSEGLWDKVLSKLQPGDFVLMQFGHNDGSSLNTRRARGTLPGIGEETEDVIMEATGNKETIHTYGWYMRKYIRDTKAKNAIPIMISLVPRNKWVNGKVERASENYAKWAAEVAKEENIFFIDLNEIVAQQYEEIGPDSVKIKFFPSDHTHTSKAGADLNAACLIKGLKILKNCPLNNYVKN